MESKEPKFEGEIVKLGGQEFVVPSLSVNQARKLWPDILEIDKGITPEQYPKKLQDSLPIILAALSRNYPDMTIETLGDLVDLRNFKRIMQIVGGQSGMGPKPGEVRQSVVVQ